MKGGSVAFLVLLLSVAQCASAASYLSFLNLGSPVTLARGDDSYSNAITSSYSIRLGYSDETTVYVSINGYFSIGTTPSDSSLSKFSRSTSYSVVAPFAADIITTTTGSVRYQTFTTGSSNINTVSSYIRSELGGFFSGNWMLVAEWNNVPHIGGSSSTTNTFQGVIITDGTMSYAVFLYYCPYMEWSENAVIGWQSSSSYYRNHPLSGTSDAKQVACLNTATSSYDTVLFKLNSVNYLRYLDLTDPVTLGRENGAYSSAITSPYPIPFGNSYSSTFYVSNNGYISVGTIPSRSPLWEISSSTTHSIVAPFAADITTWRGGPVQYQTFTTGDSNINTVSSYIRAELGVSFSGSWMLVAEWNDVECSCNSGTAYDLNTFQGLIITDGSTSYAVFLYSGMSWSWNGVIGWQASSSYYRTHPVSGTEGASPVSISRVLFRLNSVRSCASPLYFGCFDGNCVYSSLRCDGDSDCSDGSDEVACSYNYCDHGEFRCRWGPCIPVSDLCDGSNDCTENNDEEGCSVIPCHAGEFQCDNGKCKPSSYQCNNFDDCGDNSDEEGCDTDTVNTGLAVGLSVGLTVLLLSVGIPVCIVCVICCYSSRRRPFVSTRLVATTPPAAGTIAVTDAQTTSAAAPATQPLQQYHPAEFKGPQQAPPGSNYPAYPPPVPQAYPQPPQAPYGEQPYPYPQTPAYPPPTQDLSPTDAGSDTDPLLQQ